LTDPETTMKPSAVEERLPINYEFTTTDQQETT
jgi:hypothetical protein